MCTCIDLVFVIVLNMGTWNWKSPGGGRGKKDSKIKMKCVIDEIVSGNHDWKLRVEITDVKLIRACVSCMVRGRGQYWWMDMLWLHIAMATSAMRCMSKGVTVCWMRCRLLANLRLQEVPVLLLGFFSSHACLIVYSSWNFEKKK